MDTNTNTEGENSTDTPSTSQNIADENVPATSNRMSQTSIKHVKKHPQRCTIHKGKKYGTKPVLKVNPRRCSRGTQTDQSSVLPQRSTPASRTSSRSHTSISTDRAWTTSGVQTDNRSRFTGNRLQRSNGILQNVVTRPNNSRTYSIRVPRPSVMRDNANPMNTQIPVNVMAQPPMQQMNINANIPIAVPLTLPLVWQGTHFGSISLSPFFLQNQGFTNINSGTHFQ